MGNSNVDAIKALNIRVWYVAGGVHPTRAPELLALGKFSSDPSQTIGEATKISAPDPNNFNRDIQVGTVDGETERASFAIAARETPQKSILMEWKNEGCRVDFFALMGKCGNPQDFTEGGEKWVFFPDGLISSHSFENFGAFGRDENNPANEMVDVTSQEYYEFLYMSQGVIGASVTTRELYTIDTYQGDNCADCPKPCENVLMTMAGASATPGTVPSLLYSQNGGQTFAQQSISSLYSNEIINGSAVIGSDLVLISETSNSIHYTNIDLLYEGQNAWQENVSGFVAAKAPRAIWSVDVRHTWIVGNGGYIYFARNHKTTVEVQDSGVATTQNLLSVHAYDTKNALTVGNNNAVVYTKNGGVSWDSVTGPAVGINLGACWMWSADTWFIGEGPGGSGKLWLTTNRGVSWTQVSLPTGYVRIYKIEFISEAEGYISADTGSTAVVMRTKTAGNEWTVLPDGKKAVAQLNTYITDLAVCSRYANTVYASGLADNGSNGVAYKFSGG
jgi:photosystem II stability/assembly factor-like uncharacterized protein